MLNAPGGSSPGGVLPAARRHGRTARDALVRRASARSLQLSIRSTRPGLRVGARADVCGGEGGIRTLGASCPTHTLSRRAPSTTRTPLHGSENAVLAVPAASWSLAVRQGAVNER